MCLDPIVINKNELFSKSLKDEHGEYIFCYKVLKINKSKGTKYKSLYNFHSGKYTNYYLNRFNRSDRKGTRVSPSEHKFDCIYKGIHVYLTLEGALRLIRSNIHILLCKCYKKDYVAHDSSKREAVFTKIFLLNEVVKQ